MSRERSQHQGRGRERVLAQQCSQELRQGHDELDLPDVPEFQPGLAGRSRRRRRNGVLARLLGSRNPAVPLQLVEEAGRVEVRTCAAPRTSAAREALEELAALLRYVFQRERSGFTEGEWRRLLGTEPATPSERLLLLTRLAISPDTVVSASVPFEPNNRGLKRYLAKFAALPDGMPFSLHLLLADARGRKKTVSGSAAAVDMRFLELPDAVLLLAVRRTLAREQDSGRTWSDYEIGPELQRTLGELGLVLERAPSEGAVRRLRERWARKKLSLFPKAAERKREANRGRD